MFPPSVIHPLYPEHSYHTDIGHTCSVCSVGYHVDTLSHYIDRRDTGRSVPGRILHLWTKPAGLVTELLVIFSRVWLAAALINTAMA